MRLDRYLEGRLGRSARTVRHLFVDRQVLLNGVAVVDGRCRISKFCRVEVEGNVLQAREPIYLMMHKPRGCVSATRDHKNNTVLNLVNLPAKEQLHLAGRLDFNTTGLLLLTNDGDWSSRITLPQRKIPKTYRVETRHAITAEYVERFRAGIYLRHENLTTLPAELKLLSTNCAELTIYEGRYHQIKRMFGLFRNEVLGLHRLSIADIELDDSLGAGQYRHLRQEEIASIRDAQGI